MRTFSIPTPDFLSRNSQLNRIERLLDQLLEGQEKEMAAIDDLNAAAASIATDATAIATAAAAVKTAVDAFVAGAVPTSAVEAAVASLNASHTALQGDVTGLNDLAANP